MAIIDLLKDLANAARIVPLGGAKPDVGVPLSFGLAPAFPSILDTVQAGDISAIWFNKDVRFADGLGVPVGTALPNYLSAPARVLGGQLLLDPPMANLPIPGGVLTLPKILNADPTEPQKDLATGIPGFLGQLAGTLPIPVQVPVSVEVTWTVKKNGKVIEPGTEYLAPKGRNGQILELVFLASPGELILGFSPLVTFEISGTVVVKALGLSSGEIPLPPITLDVPAILGIPTVLATFRHPDYISDDGSSKGAVFLVVPNHAVLQTAHELAPVLDTLRQTITRLQSFQADAVSGNFALLLLGLGTLLDALDTQPLFQFAVGDVSNVESFHYVEHDWRVFPPRPPGGDHPDDASAVILIGVKGNGVQLFGNPGFNDTNEPDHFSIVLGTGAGMWATVKNFIVDNTDNLVVFPPKDPPFNTVLQVKQRGDHPAAVNDKISSIAFFRP